jgi:hypothetical protein
MLTSVLREAPQYGLVEPAKARRRHGVGPPGLVFK